MKRWASGLLAAMLVLGPAAFAGALAQDAEVPQLADARPADAGSVGAIVGALYEIVSGPAGRQRDWDRLRDLFVPEGRLVAVAPRPDGAFDARPMSVDAYIRRVTRQFARAGFHQSELARTTETFGQIAHVFSTYEVRHAPRDARPFQRGVNSIQLVHDGSRWYILSLLSRAEDSKLALPKRYLKSHQRAATRSVQR